MKKKKLNFSGTISIVIAILVLVVAVPINLIASYNDKVYDMTPAKKYTLNNITKELLDSTSGKQIDVYFMYPNLTDLKSVPNLLPLYHTLTQLDERSNITVRCTDPDKEPDVVEMLDPSGTLTVKTGDVFVKCGELIKRIAVDKFFQTNSDDVLEYAGEELIAGAIKTCTGDSLPTVYFLQGHGEYSIDERYRTYTRSLKANNYASADLELDKAGAVPADTAIIYLVSPKSDITDKEKDILVDYLDKGGSMSMLIDPCDTKGRFENIDYILKKFGLEMDYNTVVETQPVNQLENKDSIQDEGYFRVQYPPKTDDFTEDLTTDINILINLNERTAGISNPRSFAQLPDEQYDNAPSFEISSIIRNVTDSNGAYSTKSRAMGGDESTAEFADEELSDVELDFGFYSYNKLTGGKLIAVGSSEMIDDDTFTTDTSGSQMLVLMSNTWLKDIDVEMGIGYKMDSYDTMVFKDASEAKKTMAATAVFPVAVLVIGILVWLKRRYA